MNITKPLEINIDLLWIRFWIESLTNKKQY